MSSIRAFVITIFVGWLSSVICETMLWPQLGSIFAIATMGAFILKSIENLKEGSSEDAKSQYYKSENRQLTRECDCMGKAILAMIVTIMVGFMSSAIFANWVTAPEWGVILAVAVMGAFIILFNDKK